MSARSVAASGDQRIDRLRAAIVAVHFLNELFDIDGLAPTFVEGPKAQIDVGAQPA
jgi:hypothetical protein